MQYVLFYLIHQSSLIGLGSMWCTTLGFHWRPRRRPPSICLHMLQYAQGIDSYMCLHSVSTISSLCRYCNLFEFILWQVKSLSHWAFHISWHAFLTCFLMPFFTFSFRRTSDQAHWGASCSMPSARTLGLSCRRGSVYEVRCNCLGLLWIEV